MNPWRTLFLTGMLGAFVVCLAHAQENSDKSEPPPPKELRDPTTPGPKLKQALNANKLAKQTGPAGKLPTVVLRGRVIAKGQPALAVLEIDGKMTIAAKDAEIGSVLRVLDISGDSVRLEYVPLNQTIVLR
jgi:hypothetical protein